MTTSLPTNTKLYTGDDAVKKFMEDTITIGSLLVQDDEPTDHRQTGWLHTLVTNSASVLALSPEKIGRSITMIASSVCLLGWHAQLLEALPPSQAPTNPVPQYGDSPVVALWMKTTIMCRRFGRCLGAPAFKSTPSCTSEPTSRFCMLSSRTSWGSV
ncbi:hypothetical protein PR048_012714 [Dryococelus australis]|uniref:Uncharacterized protein n=1 Tax=Dryococelus australis TaxID=614101 RepID=A0ABQ9HQ57_9NEOP|nr:hypothetical protein PR048_012714 [Dryococelus australis]